MFDEKVIMVTGGTGSFGQAFVRMMLSGYKPKKLIVFSRDELKQHEMNLALDNPSLRFFIGDIRDKERLYRAMNEVDIVIHAAALKQVPSCEYNPFEAIKTNILGASNVIDAAIDRGVDQVIAISTDKAVNPINLYGATKLCAEKLFIQSNAYSGVGGTKFSCTRYGNVVGSRGSVIPLFQDQRTKGKITVTDERMTRFWITMDQGVHFVMRCIEIMHGGEVFIPKVPSMRLTDLVQAVAPECEVDVIGIRPGEKVHEVLISQDEAISAREFDDKYVIEPAHPGKNLNNWHHGKRLPSGFQYASDTNSQWLTVQELQQMIQTE